MSTRSGKRIHTSLLEDTATTVQEPAEKGERKTRSKRVKENLDELSVSILKNKKRNNYVTYPTDDELHGNTATKKEVETKPSRSLRKNALKEHNPVENSEQLELHIETENLIRKSRRFKRVDDAEEAENHENVAEITEVPKSKKSKKKKKVETVVDNPSTAEAPTKKSKKKKKKGKGTSSIIVEDVPINENSKNALLNGSSMSVDSFHSAAGSPCRNENKDTVPANVPLSPTFNKIKENNITFKNTRKNNKKNSSNNTIDKLDESVNMAIDKVNENKSNNKSNKKRKPVSEELLLVDQCFVSVARDNLEKGLEDIMNVSHLSNGQLKRRKSKSQDAKFDKSNTSKDLNIEKATESNLNVSNKSKRRKSNIKQVNEVSVPEKVLEDADNVLSNDTFDKGLRRNSIVKDVTFDGSNASIAKEIVDADNILNISKKQLKTRNSMVINSTFDKSNASIAKEIVDTDDISNISNNQHKIRKSMVTNSTFDKSNASIAKEIADDDVNVLNISNKQHKTRKSMVINSTFDKSNASIAKEIAHNNNDVDDLNISNRQNKTRKSITKNCTFDKSNASISKEIVDDNDDIDISNISNKPHNTRKSMAKNNTFDKSNASVTKEALDVEIDSNVSKKHLKTRKSILKDSTFDKSNASLTNTHHIQATETDLNVSNVSNKQENRSNSNVIYSTFDKQESILNTTFEKETEEDVASIKDSTFNKSNHKQLDATYEKDLISDTSAQKKEKTSVNTTYDKTDKAADSTFEKDISTSFDAFKKGAMTRKSSFRDASFDKSNFSIASLSKEDFEKDNNIISSSTTKRRPIRQTFDKNDTISEQAVNTTYEKTEKSDNNLKRKSPRQSKTPDIQTVLNTTFEKENTNDETENVISGSKSSLMTSDNSVVDKSDISRISITSDDTLEHTENIVNTTPLLIESSIDESHVSITKPESPKPQTPLKREGTFTKDSPKQTEAEAGTPTKRKSVPTAGCTPYHVTKSSQKKSMLNVTRSLEKGVRGTADPAPRLTRVMFCSPVDNPVTFTQEKRKVIKSNLKGSNKSFVFEENDASSRAGRKRSYTQNDADDSRVKRTRLADLQQSVDRLSRPRTTSATAKLSVVTPKKPPTPSKPKSDGNPSRTKLPNFAAMHQKQFDKMESLDECQERRAKRAKQLLTPTAPPGLLDRISPKNTTESPKKSKELVKPKEKTETPTKAPAPETTRPGFTRFGFKLNLDVNPFSIPSKTVEKPKEKPVEKPNGLLPRHGILPSLTGATSVRREVAKLTVMREKSFTDRRNVKRNENRTVIKGVRTNRRFELQMKMRNIDKDE